MASADELNKQEQAGNTFDDKNVGQQQSDALFNKKPTQDERDIDDIVDDNDYSKNPTNTKELGGDVVNKNYNADENREDIQEREQQPSLYNQDSTKGVRGGLASWFARKGKKYGASTGVLGILGVGMIVISVTLSPAALFATIEKSLTNDGSDFSRTNSTIWRAYRGTLFKGDCTGSKLKCKFTTATKKQLSKWVENRFKVTGVIVGADGKEKSGGEREIKPDEVKEGERVKMSAVEFPNGVKATNNREFEGETSRNIESRKWGLRVVQDKAGSFFTEKFSKGVLGKWGLSKGAIAKKNSRPAETEDQKKKQINDAREKANSKVSGALDKFTKGAGLVTSPVTTGCTIYNTLRIIVGTVKAKWVADVVKFAFPFVQIASKLADGSATDADFDEITGRADQLVWYQSDKYTEELASKASSTEDKTKILSKKNLSGTDAQGLRMAMYGDTTKLLDFTKDYTTGGIGSVAALGDGIKEFQDAFPGGRQGIRTTCINAQRGALIEGGVQAITCILSGAVSLGLAAAGCIAKIVATTVAGNILQDKLMDYITQELLKRLMSADIPSDLRGVDAGNALAAGMGMMLSQTSLGHGMKPAKSAEEVKNFIAMTDQNYYQDYTDIAMQEAANDPFDLYNQYSFASILNTSLNPYISGHKSGFATITNMLSVIKNTFMPSVNALYSQPSLMTNSEANLNHRLNVINGKATCVDYDKYDIDVACDWSGRIVGVSSQQVLKWSLQMASGNTDPLEDTLNYMQQQGKFKDIGSKGEKDGGTYDETCASFDNAFSATFGAGCDASKKPSINEDGSVVDGSQYSLYKKYCTEARQLDIGSSEEALETGTEKDQDWMTGKQCAKDSEMMDRFALYFNLCETQYAMANDATDCVSEGSTQVTTGSGDACSLINNPNIVYVNEGTKKGLQEICDTGHSVNSCGNTNYTLDQELMNVVTTLSSKYKVWLNNFGFKYDRNSCDTGQHPKGKAVDLNGIEKLDGSGRAGGSEWGGITYGDPKQVKVINDYATDWLASIDPSHGGVGQKGCSSSFNPTFPANASNVNGAAFFNDSCDHLHIDVRDRGSGGRSENRTSLGSTPSAL